MARKQEQPSVKDTLIGGVIVLALIIGGVAGCRAMIASSDSYLEECSREAAAKVLELRFGVPDVEGVERGDYDDILAEACYGR